MVICLSIFTFLLYCNWFCTKYISINIEYFLRIFKIKQSNYLLKNTKEQIKIEMFILYEKIM